MANNKNLIYMKDLPEEMLITLKKISKIKNLSNSTIGSILNARKAKAEISNVDILRKELDQIEKMVFNIETRINENLRRCELLQKKIVEKQKEMIKVQTEVAVEGEKLGSNPTEEKLNDWQNLCYKSIVLETEYNELFSKFKKINQKILNDHIKIEKLEDDFPQFFKQELAVERQEIITEKTQEKLLRLPVDLGVKVKLLFTNNKITKTIYRLYKDRITDFNTAKQLKQLTSEELKNLIPSAEQISELSEIVQAAGKTKEEHILYMNKKAEADDQVIEDYINGKLNARDVINMDMISIDDFRRSLEYSNDLFKKRMQWVKMQKDKIKYKYLSEIKEDYEWVLENEKIIEMDIDKVDVKVGNEICTIRLNNLIKDMERYEKLDDLRSSPIIQSMTTLKNRTDKVIAALKNKTLKYSELSEFDRYYRCVAEEAIKIDGRNIEYAGPNLQKDQKLVTLAEKTYPEAKKYLLAPIGKPVLINESQEKTKSKEKPSTKPKQPKTDFVGEFINNLEFTKQKEYREYVANSIKKLPKEEQKTILSLLDEAFQKSKNLDILKSEVSNLVSMYDLKDLEGQEYYTGKKVKYKSGILIGTEDGVFINSDKTVNYQAKHARNVPDKEIKNVDGKSSKAQLEALKKAKEIYKSAKTITVKDNQGTSKTGKSR